MTETASSTSTPRGMPWPVRCRIALATGGAGLLVSLAILGPEVRFDAGADGLWVPLWFFAASAVGAALAGLVTAPLFGRPGAPGWGFALLGSVLATALGGAIGGSLIFPGYGTILGSAFVFMSMTDRPLIVPLWGISMAAVHHYAKRLRSAAT